MMLALAILLIVGLTFGLEQLTVMTFRNDRQHFIQADANEQAGIANNAAAISRDESRLQVLEMQQAVATNDIAWIKQAMAAQWGLDPNRPISQQRTH